MNKAAQEAMVAEMYDIRAEEEKQAAKKMVDIDCDLGVGILDPKDSARHVFVCCRKRSIFEIELINSYLVWQLLCHSFCLHMRDFT